MSWTPPTTTTSAASPVYGSAKPTGQPTTAPPRISTAHARNWQTTHRP
jgi:hypothetical protein